MQGRGLDGLYNLKVCKLENFSCIFAGVLKDPLEK